MALVAAVVAVPGLSKGHRFRGCVFTSGVTSSSTIENVKLLHTTARHKKGKVRFHGNGLDQTKSFTLGSNGTAVVPFMLTQLGSSTITVNLSTVPPETITLTFNLGASNDVEQTGCTPK